MYQYIFDFELSCPLSKTYLSMFIMEKVRYRQIINYQLAFTIKKSKFHARERVILFKDRIKKENINIQNILL